MPDSLRLAIGVFTRIPVSPPERAERRTAGTAMLLGPFISLLVALVIGIPLQVATNVGPMPAFVAAALAVTALTAARSPAFATFSVATVLVALVEAACLTDLFARGAGAGSLAVAVVTGGLAMTLACTRGIPCAQQDGLGPVIADSVWRGAAAVLAIAWGAFAAVSVGNAHGVGAGLSTAAAVVAALLLAGAMVHRSRRRRGGTTRELLGSIAEVATATVLVILVVLPG